MKFVPAKKNLLVEVDAPKEKTDSGIYIVNHDYPPRDIMAGFIKVSNSELYPYLQRIFFKRDEGVTITLDKKNYVLVHETDVLGTMVDE